MEGGMDFSVNINSNSILIFFTAIIGGGIGGASASHFLTELLNGNLDIDLYEAKTIGGRLATVKIDNNEVEAGGAIIHPKNMYMQKFVKLLGLEHKLPNDEKNGIWNGDKFVYKDSSYYIVSLTKLLYRYGFQLFHLKWYINNIIDDFVKIYELQDAGKSFANVSALLSAMNEEFPKLLQISIKDQLLQAGFTTRLIDEMVQAAIVVNYGQETDIQSFVGLVALAGVGADLWSVKGGNKGVPEHLIYRNKNVNVIPSRVTKIRNVADKNAKQYEVTYINKDSTDPMTSDYDIVIIAAPLTSDHKFPIEFTEFPDNLAFPGAYQTTYATFVKADLNPQYFGLQEPLDGILSCDPNKTIISSVGEVSSVNGLSKTDSGVWKVFSRKPLETSLVHKMFSNIIEKKEIAWKAYPRYTTDVPLNNFKLHDALYHVNAIEWIASAMEISAMGGRNVAILAYNDFLQKYNYSLSIDIHTDATKKLFTADEL
ncbi:hypothetical protein DMN91_010425 [Ooceraea biroi]|uniref:Prenylcysteine oxidase-like protein n=1 Tax=Ooceraea biroi TaxID=2015173 RepID=A0A026WD77_OOCBI|nr:Prenylcysteine oxidase-like protein [Ooceraea biroi]RLU18182.1 hypothetical protein DMN91_010425 [Ooceraea biroi]